MCMSNEDFLDSTHLNRALLYLMLSSLSTVKEPYIAVQPESKRGVVPGGRWLSRCCAQKCNVDVNA